MKVFQWSLSQVLFGTYLNTKLFVVYLKSDLSGSPVFDLAVLFIRSLAPGPAVWRRAHSDTEVPPSSGYSSFQKTLTRRQADPCRLPPYGRSHGLCWALNRGSVEFLAIALWVTRPCRRILTGQETTLKMVNQQLSLQSKKFCSCHLKFFCLISEIRNCEKAPEANVCFKSICLGCWQPAWRTGSDPVTLAVSQGLGDSSDRARSRPGNCPPPHHSISSLWYLCLSLIIVLVYAHMLE